MVGAVPFVSPSSRARSAGWTVCAAVHGSGGRFSCPRMAGTATRAPDAANRIATAETKKTAWRRFVSGAKELLKRRSILGRVDLWIQRNCRLFLEVGPRALEFHGCGAESLRNVLIGGEALEVDGVEHGEHVKGDVQRRLGIVDEIAYHGIVLAEIAVAGDEAKDFIGKAGHRSKSLDFLIGEAWRLQHGALHNFVAVADQRAARF